MYNPKLDILTALKKADRPLTAKQLQKLLPAIPNGTISSSLHTFWKLKIVEDTPEGYRMIVKEIPEKYIAGRLHGPRQNKGRRKSKAPDAVLLMIPLPKGESAVVTVEEAKRIFEALQPFFKE
jgi:hypothetical protein